MNDAMLWPTWEEWSRLVPIAKLEVAAEKLAEARKRRKPSATVVTLNEERALSLLEDALKALGYKRHVDLVAQYRRRQEAS